MKSYDKLYSKIEETYKGATKKDIKIESNISEKLIKELLNKNKFADADKLYDVINDHGAYVAAISDTVRALWANNDEKAINHMISYPHLNGIVIEFTGELFKSIFYQRTFSEVEDLYKRVDRTFGPGAKSILINSTCNRITEICGKTKGFDEITDFLKNVKNSSIDTISNMHLTLKNSKKDEILDCACKDLNSISQTPDKDVSKLVDIYNKYYADWIVYTEKKFIDCFITALESRVFDDIIEMYERTDCIRNYDGDLKERIDEQIRIFVVGYIVEEFENCTNITEMNEAVSHIREADCCMTVTESVVNSYDAYAEDILFNTGSMDELNSEIQLISESQLMNKYFDTSCISYAKAVIKKLDDMDIEDFSSIDLIHSKINNRYVSELGALKNDIEYRYTLSLMYHVSETLNKDDDANVDILLGNATFKAGNLGLISKLIKVYISSKSWNITDYQSFIEMSGTMINEMHSYQRDELPLIDRYYTKTIARTNIHRNEKNVKDVLEYLCEEYQPGSLLLKNIDKLLYSIEYFEPTDDIITNMRISQVQSEYSDLIEVLSEYVIWFNDGNNSKHLLDLCDNVFNNCTRDMDLCLAYAIAGAVNESDCSWTYALNNYIEAAKYDKFGKGYIDKCAEVSIKASNKETALRYASESGTIMSGLYAIEAEMLTNKRVRNKLVSAPTDTNYTKAYKSLLSGITEFELGVADKAMNFYSDGLKDVDNDRTTHGRILNARLLLGRGRSQAIIDKDRIYLSNADFEKAIDILSVFPASRRDIKMLIEDIERTKASINNKTEKVEQVSVKNDGQNQYATLDIPGFQTVTIMGEAVGQGGKYKVYAGTGNDDNKKYAVRIHKDINPYHSATIPLSGDEIKAMKRETEIWELLSDECPEKIVRLVGFANIKYPVHVMEWADNSFEKAITGLSTRESREIIISVLEELQSIHDCDIIHNDVKPENVLQVGKYWKLADFDTSFFVGEEYDVYRATYQYKSPEHFKNMEITPKSDVWAAGVMTYYVLTRGTYPFDGGETQYESNVCDGNYRAGALDSKFVPLFDKVFSVEPKERPTAKEFADELKNLI